VAILVAIWQRVFPRPSFERKVISGKPILSAQADQFVSFVLRADEVVE
jgi:hypothetical protein